MDNEVHADAECEMREGGGSCEWKGVYMDRTGEQEQGISRKEKKTKKKKEKEREFYMSFSLSSAPFSLALKKSSR